MSSLNQENPSRITRGLIELVIMQFLEAKAMSAPQIVRGVSGTFGLRCGIKTMYEVLESLEEEGLVKQEHLHSVKKPRIIYDLTTEGRNVLGYTSISLNTECAHALLPVAMTF